jgi:hypothetical protein
MITMHNRYSFIVYFYYGRFGQGESQNKSENDNLSETVHVSSKFQKYIIPSADVLYLPDIELVG